LKVIIHKFNDYDRRRSITLVPLGDIHIGADACNEGRLKNVIKRIEDDPNCFWIGMGDYADFIQRSDPRFNVGGLADWIQMADLVDLSRAQRDRFLGFIKPIAHKCLAFLQGNHETSITRHYERNVYYEMTMAIREMGDLDDIALDYNGWLALKFYAGKKESNTVRIYLHHGFVGGKLAGAKALNMQRMLWVFDADLILMGHSHNVDISAQQVTGLSDYGKIVEKRRIGAYTGTFLSSFSESGSTYAEVKGYFPQPNSGIEVQIVRPLSHDSRIEVTSSI